MVFTALYFPGYVLLYSLCREPVRYLIVIVCFGVAQGMNDCVPLVRACLLGLFAAVILQRHDCPLQVKHIEYENSGGAFVCSKPESVKLMLTGVQRKTPLECCTRDV